MPRPRNRWFNVRTLVALVAIGLPLVFFTNAFVEAVVFGGVHRHQGYTDVDLKALGCFPFDAETDAIENVPSKFRALDGQRVVMTGYMFNSQAAGPSVRKFEFVYNIQKCCFGAPPKVQERVFARCPNHTSVPYAQELQRLTGILHVKINRDAVTGTVTSVYALDVEKCEPVKGGLFGLFE